VCDGFNGGACIEVSYREDEQKAERGEPISPKNALSDPALYVTPSKILRAAGKDFFEFFATGKKADIWAQFFLNGIAKTTTPRLSPRR
jgi:hypothetical protein